jgi:sugar phosphate isomerase/epimerase
MAFRFAYSTNAYTRVPLEEAIDDIGKRGFEGLEILADVPHAFPPRVQDPTALRERIRAAGLEISNLNGNTSAGLDPGGRDPSGFWPSLVDPDPAARRRKIDYVKGVMDLARSLGAGNVCTASGTPPKGIPKAKAWETMARSLEILAAHAEKKPEVRLGVEFEPGFLLGDSRSTARMLEELDHPLLGVNLDLGHARCVGEDPADAVAAFAERIWNVDLEDIRGRVHEHLVPGRGDLDFRRIFRALERARYDRFVTLELYPYKDDPGGAGEEGLRHLKGLVS